MHRFEPNEYYKKMYEIIKRYEITIDEMVDGKIGQIYYRILCDIGEKRGRGPAYSRMHFGIFPLT